MLKKPVRTQKQLAHKNADLRARLAEAEETLRAIRSSEVDALVIPGVSGDQLYTLKDANRSYRVLIEEMNEGALTVTTDGVILYANRRCAEILKAPLEKVIGSMIDAWVAPADKKILQSLLRKGVDEKRREELALTASDGTLVPVFLSASNLLINETPASFFCLVATDLTEQKRSEAIAAAETLARELLAASNQARLDLLSMVEDLKRSEEALRESKRFVQGTLDALSAHIAILDASGQIVAVNRAWREFAIANHPNPQSVCEGANYLAICEAARGPRSEEAASMGQGLRAIISGAQNGYLLEYPCHAPHKQRWFVARITSFENNEQRWIVVAHENITERKQAGDQTRFQATLLDAVGQAVIATDAAGTVTYVNRAAENLYGWRAEETMGHSILDVTVPQTSQTQAEEIMAYLSRGESWSGEFLVQHRDGRVFPAEVHDSPIFNSENVLIGVIGVSSDITQRKQAEENLRGNEERLRQVWEATSDAMALSDANGVMLSANPAYCNLYGYTPEQITGRNFAVIFPEAVQEQALEQYKAVFSGENIPAAFESIVQHADGTEHIVESKISFVSNAGRRIAMLSTIRDITEHKQVEKTRRQYMLELERRVEERTRELTHANRIKDEFLATMSHELRTPLNSVLGLSEMLLEQRRDPLSAYQQRSIQIIEASGRHLLELINDVLDLSKIEAGKFDYYPQVVNVDDLCHSSLAFIREQALQKSITITYKKKTTVSKIYADPRRLKQILINLLANAVKFTLSNGEVTLQVDAEAERDRIQFSIIDTGIGIAAEDLKKLFQPFVQLDSRLTREYEGTGLGLALVQRLTDLHGGSVRVESDGVPGKGSRFTVNLAMGQAILAQQIALESGGKVVDQVMHKPAAEPLGLMTILLVEDNMSSILMMGDYLEIKGYQVVVAHDGVEALEQAEAHQPDMILMDIQMPGMDGLEAIRRLRGNPSFASTPIIALTALAMPGDRERCLEAGANEYMSKPVSLKNLVKTIENFLAYKMNNGR